MNWRELKFEMARLAHSVPTSELDQALLREGISSTEAAFLLYTRFPGSPHPGLGLHVLSRCHDAQDPGSIRAVAAAYSLHQLQGWRGFEADVATVLRERRWLEIDPGADDGRAILSLCEVGRLCHSPAVLSMGREKLNQSLGAGLGDTLVATLLRDGWLAADAEFRAHLDPDEDE
ncbi:hypothetical protein [Deinococcus daejeonensis]|uniref:Uncharacterized protein n=1 Tax=Deinococcus daejeonensis TaxID=1007098 RepID=A0ABQ2JC86_9DEIO|nr:hypothetical protein [Deinococcus daejeonensis]GGN42711.1 hypothetical protein GCM10010842_29410 [Deinococcus daejeonensis]